MQSNDDPPLLYINVGTEVSAKFKGAFCEAKISKVDKQVKCKVTFKRTNQSATLSDEFIRSKTGELLGINEFKIGSVVSVVNQGGKNAEPQLATLNKIIDQSSYTVVFNDGDEKVVRRSFIRFKGERHYLNSETLDNAPLNNPEHFLQPIKNNSDFPNSPVPKLITSKLSPSLTDRTSDTKRTSNPTDDESYDDSLYEDAATTPNSSARLQRSSAKPEQTNKQNQFKKMKKLAHSDDEDRLSKTAENTEDPTNLSSSEGSDSESSNDSDSSDDFPSEIKDRFVAQLYKFMDDRGTSMNRVPTIDGVDIDLHRVFIIVRRYGGYNKVCKVRAWADVYKRLQTVPNFPPTSSSNVVNLKSAYKRYLQPFEDFYRKLGSTMCDLVSRHTSSKSRLSDSQSTSRSLQLFKNRYINKSDTQKKGAAPNKASKLKCSTSSGSAAKTKSELDDRVVSPNNSETSKVTKVETDIETDLKTPASSENLTIESMISSPQASTKSLLEDQSQQPNEEVSLFSMMRKINDNYKMAKKEKEKAKTKEEIVVKEEPSQPKEETKKPLKSSPSQPKTKQSEIKVSDNKSKDKEKKVAVKTEKTTPATGARAKCKSDDENEESEVNSKRKANRLSISGSDDTEKSVKRKKTSSLNNKSISSNNETNDETDDDKDGPGPGSAASRSVSIDRNNETEPEKDSKSGSIVFSDLEIDRVVDVKYSYGGKMHNYRAKILQTNKEDQKVLVHYLGWNSRYDEWIKVNRVLKLLSDDFSCGKRKKPTQSGSKQTASNNSNTNKDLSIQPDIQPVSSPSQLVSSPSQTPKSSPTVQKSNSQLKSLNKSLTDTYQRSLSCTSTCSSEQSKEELSDVSAAEKRYASNDSTTPKIVNKNEEKASLAIKTRSSDSSSSVSSPYSYRKRSNENKTDSDDLTIKSENNRSDFEENATDLTTLLSIKEELVETEPMNVEAKIANDGDLSFTLADPDDSKKSPKKATVNTSRKNSLNESLNSSRKSLVSSRKNSTNEKPSESPKKEDPKQQVLGEIEVSFNDVEPSFSTANSTLVTFDIGNPRLSVNSESKLSEKEKLEKETWEKICSLNSSFNKSFESEKSKSDKQQPGNSSDSEKKQSSLALKDFVTLNEKSQDATSVDKNKKQNKSLLSESDQEDAKNSNNNNSKAVVNKENDNVRNEKDAKKALSHENKSRTESNNKNSSKSLVNEENVLSISKSNENSLAQNTFGVRYSFNLNEVNLVGKQKIRYIEEQMKLCRESYAKLKSEIAAIDRKKKKLKRSYMDKSGNNSYAIGNTTSNEESSKQEMSNLTKNK